MATENLNLSIINASDYVSPTPINDNMEKIDKLGLDYIVEQGTSGEWWYRKWNSGRAECGIDNKSFGNVDHKSPWGGMYTSPQLSFGAYPFAFASAPFVIISFLYSVGHYSYVGQGGTNSTTLSPNFYLVDPNSGTANDAKFGIFVCGRYK